MKKLPEVVEVFPTANIEEVDPCQHCIWKFAMEVIAQLKRSAGSPFYTPDMAALVVENMAKFPKGQAADYREMGSRSEDMNAIDVTPYTKPLSPKQITDAFTQAIKEIDDATAIRLPGEREHQKD